MNATTTLVPQADPGASYRAQKAEIDAAIQRVLESGWYILGKEDVAFEQEFAAWLGAGTQPQHAVGCANGTDALVLALRGLRVGPGATVVTVSHTAVATVAAIEMAGATPLLLDIDPDTYCMDPDELISVLESPPPGLPPIKAVIPVHLYGQACDLTRMLAACDEAGVALIEDVSQAHGATLGGRKLGTFGKIACFSLYPTKNLGALGDAGIVSTTDATLAADIGAIRQYGWRERYISDLVGVNSRLDEIQAAILRVKLTVLDANIARRRQIAAAYDAALVESDLVPPARVDGVEHAFHQYVLRSPRRDELQARLRAMGVATSIHYPLPVHRQGAYAGRIALGPAGCQETEAAAREVFSLPLYPEMTDSQVAQVCAALKSL
ncbi:DegT/DnrJ/EryC1/StrS family aminotransferase [Acetobacteraceae bacterium H6797]|nr:DegT/DnrJ/EryC1/StrS family aminotransferase [Acetobacteraceae bacterium H6797]